MHIRRNRRKHASRRERASVTDKGGTAGSSQLPAAPYPSPSSAQAEEVIIL